MAPQPISSAWPWHPAVAKHLQKCGWRPGKPSNAFSTLISLSCGITRIITCHIIHVLLHCCREQQVRGHGFLPLRPHLGQVRVGLSLAQSSSSPQGDLLEIPA